MVTSFVVKGVESIVHITTFKFASGEEGVYFKPFGPRFSAHMKNRRYWLSIRAVMNLAVG